MARNLLTSRRVVRLAFLAALMASATAVLHAQNGERRLPRRGSASIDAATANADAGRGDHAIRLREGSELQAVSGTFKSTGDRITFYPDEQSDSYRTLENQSLERIWGILQELADRQWTVSGIVTEYRGSNYLLVTRAVLETKDAAAN